MQNENTTIYKYIPQKIWETQSNEMQLKLAAALYIAKLSKLSPEDWPAIFQRQKSTGTPING
ncbi:hypothetical protein GCM10009114_30140 [Aliiglaciecola litoralis]|uniref:Uncharacterized protein n=1 Tax=Aliiglaciecola litoralis TaxID=582857 RepID=A0ABP3WZG6_9ALTE